MELDNIAELVFLETAQVIELPESISQAENAGSIPVTRSIHPSIHPWRSDRFWAQIVPASETNPVRDLHCDGGPLVGQGVQGTSCMVSVCVPLVSVTSVPLTS